MCWPSAEIGPAAIPGLDPAHYRRHAIHGEDRGWAETNCYTDVMVELVHSAGHEPEAMLAFTLAIDFEGDQWTFFKPRANEGVVETIIPFMAGMFEDRPISFRQGQFPGPGSGPHGLVLDRKSVLNHVVRNAGEPLGNLQILA